MYRLTRVAALDKPHDPVVSLRDLIGTADLAKMYQFNYMHDIPWVMSHTVSQPESHFIYGYYGKDQEGEALKRQAKGYTNVSVHGVSLPAPYSTHHSKMMVLFFKDGTCKVVVHTANLIEFDWANMTQGVWQTPRLRQSGQDETQKFRADLRRYLTAYNIAVARNLASELRNYDFGGINKKFQFVASVPGNYTCKSFGIKRVQNQVPVTDKVVIQCSSIATLPKDYLEILKQDFNTSYLSIVYPTVKQVADSLNGYGSGTSIHLKRQTAPQLEQYKQLEPNLRQWRSIKAGRQLAAPHIKTYTGLEDGKVKWFLLTSANLSKQAWGVYNKKRKTQWIQSWEAGVLQVFDEPQEPAYYRDNVGWCLPFDLPDIKYENSDIAWSPHNQYLEPDQYGRRWPF